MQVLPTQVLLERPQLEQRVEALRVPPLKEARPQLEQQAEQWQGEHLAAELKLQRRGRPKANLEIPALPEQEEHRERPRVPHRVCPISLLLNQHPLSRHSPRRRCRRITKLVLPRPRLGALQRQT